MIIHQRDIRLMVNFSTTRWRSVGKPGTLETLNVGHNRAVSSLESSRNKEG